MQPQQGIRKRVIKDEGIKPVSEVDGRRLEHNIYTTRSGPEDRGTFRLVLLLPLTALLVLFGVVGTLRMRQHATEQTARTSTHVLTPEELAMYDGKHRRGGPLYLGILGSVFDVTQGKRHYGPGGSYHFFAGRDASRAFTTGKFDADLHDDVRDISPERMAELVDWRNFYHTSAKYVYVGRVIGRFYNAKGTPLPLLGIVESHAADYKKEVEKNATQSSNAGARCGFRWHKDSGSQVYCDEKDGTVPRRVTVSQESGDICLCLPLAQAGVNDTVHGYPGCPTDSSMCFTEKQTS